MTDLAEFLYDIKTEKIVFSLPKEEAMKRLLTYTTFFISRDPFQRLVSAYYNKFVELNSGAIIENIGKPVALKQAKDYIPDLNYTVDSR